MMRLSTFLTVLCLLSSCSAPVRRDSPSGQPLGATSGEAQIPKIEAPKKRIWVLDFAQRVPSPAELTGVDVPGVLRQALIETFETEENSAFLPVLNNESVLTELGISSDTDVADVSRIARGSDVLGFLRAEVMELSVREDLEKEGIIQERKITLSVGLSFSLVDASTGKEAARGTRRRDVIEVRSDFLGLKSRLTEPQKQLSTTGKELSKWMLADLNLQAHKIGWAGRVLKVEGARIFLNAGRSSGINLGDVFKIVEMPRDIFDPQTETFIGQAPGRIKGTTKVVEHFGLDGSVALLQSGGGIQPGDRVELF